MGRLFAKSQPWYLLTQLNLLYNLTWHWLSSTPNDIGLIVSFLFLTIAAAKVFILHLF